VWVLSVSTLLLSVNVLDVLMSSLQLLKVDVLKETIVKFCWQGPKSFKGPIMNCESLPFSHLMDLLNDSRT